ncbi:MAG: hypothetical protein JST84_09420 [Acidobacteria bacterium]|nr:hypothetical protein [Acidobacteriota bacterium]
MLTNDEFIQQFLDGTLESFHHSDHVKMAWLYLHRYELPEAIAQFTRALKRFATAKGAPNLYHETITWAFMLLINQRIQSASEPGWEAFTMQNPDLLNWEKNVLHQFYRKETLQSDFARRVFVFPDKVEGGSANQES